MSPLAPARFKRPRPSPLPRCLAALLALAAPCVHAQDAPAADDNADIAPIDSRALDADVYATLLPTGDVASRDIVESAIAAVLVTKADARNTPVVPASPAKPAPLAPKPLHVDSSPVIDSPATLQLAGQLVRVHADGLPAPNAPSADPFVRVLPRAVNPGDVQVGAHWGSQERIDAPLLSGIAWNANADVFAGPTPHPAVRRSLRISAQWDDPQDLTIGVTPGVEHVGGSLFEHHVTGLQASTVDKTQAARWHGFIEVSGEKLGPNNLIDNATAQVHAGASYSTSNMAQLDVTVSRGTTAVSDFQSAVGLQVHF